MPRFAATCLLVIACLTASAAAAADAPAKPELKELKEAGLNVGSARGGGVSVGVKSAADLTEPVWKNLEAVDLRSFFLGGDGSKLGDEQLARLCNCKGLETIFINGPVLTDEGLAALARLPKLRQFGVHHSHAKTAFRGAGFAALKESKSFEALEFGGGMIDDKGMEGIAQLAQLKKLGIFHTNITAAGFPLLARLTNLEHLGIGPSFNPDFTGADLRHLAGLKNLQELIVEKMVLPYEDGLSHLAGLKQLKKLTLRECGIADADLSRLKDALPDTKIDYKPASAENIARWNKALERKQKK